MPAFVTIDLEAIAQNWLYLRRISAPAECGAVVKADSYGLGCLRISVLLANLGCRWFFVAQAEEGIALKQALPSIHVVCLGGIREGEETSFYTYRIIPTLNHWQEIEQWRRLAQEKNVSLPAFIHLDSGMNRLGLEEREVDHLKRTADSLQGIDVWSWMSHFACADDPDSTMTAEQYNRFRVLCQGLETGRKSLCNSSGIFRGRDYHLDLVRPGCALYGINPTPETSNPSQSVVSLYAPIHQIRTLDPPATIGYAASRQVDRPTRLAVVGVGYADGYLRRLSDRSTVFIQGYPAPVLGRISMDLITVDITDIPESVVDLTSWAEIIGPNRPLDDLALDADTIGHELITDLGSRYERRYLIPQKTDLWYF